MSFVNVSIGDSPIIAQFPATRIMCIVGKTAADVGIITNVQASTISDTSNLPLGSNGGRLAATDNLYLAAVKYFQENPGGTLVLGGVNASGSEHALELLEKISTSIWNSRYAPLDGDTTITGTLSGGDRVAINEIEIQLSSVGVAEINADAEYGSESEGNWYVIDDSLVDDNNTTDDQVSVELVDGIYTGKIEFTGDEIQIVPDGTHAVSVSVINITAIRATVASLPVSETVNGLLAPGVSFDGFAFAYDDSLEGDTATSSKYAAAECVGGVGWLHDVILGSNLVKQLNASKQYCMFYFGLPEKVLPTDNISDDMAVGTSYLSTGDGPIKYDALRAIIGTNKYVAAFVSKQTFGASATDPAIAAMAALAKRSYRSSLTFATSSFGQIDTVPSPEFSLWKLSRINCYYYDKSDDSWQWGSNLTFGSGNDGNINYIRCVNKFAEIVQAVLNTVLKAGLQYDVSGYNAIRSAIVAVQDSSIGLYIDGKGSITIPYETLVRREGSLTVGEAALLVSLRATKTIDGIGIGIRWNNDIEYIYVTSIQVET